MTEDLKATYETIDSLQMQENYDELRQIVEYATAALKNDGEKINSEGN